MPPARTEAACGLVESVRVGRRNHDTVNREAAMRHPAQANGQIGDLLDRLELDKGAPAPGT